MLAAFDDVLSLVAQWLVLFSLIPTGYFTVDYVIVRPLLRARDAAGLKQPKYVPWWKSGIGVMFAMLGSSLFLTNVVITLSLFLGVDYPGRQVVRVILYAYCAVAVSVMAIVYGLESRTAQGILVKRGGE